MKQSQQITSAVYAVPLFRHGHVMALYKLSLL